MANPIEKLPSKNGRLPAEAEPESSQPAPGREVRADILHSAVTADRVFDLILPLDFPIGPVEVIVISKMK